MDGWDVVQNYRDAINGVRIWLSDVKSVREIENVKVTCSVIRMDRIRNECLRRSIYANVTGKMRERE